MCAIASIMTAVFRTVAVGLLPCLQYAFTRRPKLRESSNDRATDLSRLVVCGMEHTRSARRLLMVTGVEPPGMGTHTLDDDVRESRISAGGLKEGGRGCSIERGRRLLWGGLPLREAAR